MVGSLFPDEGTTEGRSIARVALPLPSDRLFDYAVPAANASEELRGRRVRVRAGGQRMIGVVVATLPADRAEPGDGGRRLHTIERVLDAAPVFPGRLLDALLEEARDLLCAPGIALQTALPPGGAPRAVDALALTDRGREALRAGALRGNAAELLAWLAKRPRTRRELVRRAPELGERLDVFAQDGLIARTVLERGPRVRAPRERWARLVADSPIEALLDGALARAPRQAELVRALSAGAQRVASLAERFPRASDTLRALERRGLVELEERDLLPGPVAADEPDTTVTLTDEQATACAELASAIRERRATPFLLHGVTGSGKTEVYMRAIADALALGRQALVLVPEITLTHQILGRLRARFGDQLAVLHSGLKPSERLAQWKRLRRGEVPIAVGARSALFAPLRDLGVIVIDEEHDGAYKNEEGFRYHARRFALRRARAEACPLILGSATPSLEVRYAAERGAVHRLRLEHRIGSQPLPAVELVDLKEERAALPRGRKLILGSALLRGLRSTVDEGGQAILFLNRRGFSTQIACFDCQHVCRCKHCDISLTYHAAAGRLRCHYCDHQELPPELCPECGSDATALLGLGTERLEEEVRSHLGAARIARLDRDVAARRGATEEVLRQLREGVIDVLIGTQMVAKGHDFPGVRLVGVVNADLGLHFPDFRAAERTFQLLTQVAGRAGRGGLPGRVVVQTSCPEHYAVAPVAQHDYEGFYREELGHRAALAYPPFASLAQVRVSAEDEARASAVAQELAAHARRAGSGEPCEVLGPAPAPISRLRGRHRFQVLLKHRRADVVRAAAEQVAVALERLPTGVRASVDLHPIDML
ncbi:MAG: primosomal protein N' [Deltaproteobacteria bacterium]|nr:primosomal protein N' [Deltaproteobacteria bacterium]